MASFLDIDPALFDPASISEETKAFNKAAQDIMVGAPKWYEVGAPKYRQMRAAGETPLPAATHLDSAEDIDIPSRDSGRSIPCRVLRPQNTNSPIRGVFLHIHGGGWVLQDQKSQDPVLQLLSNNTGLLCLSVGYRLAPENTFPAGPNDCFDVAEYLVQNAEAKFGAPLAFTGGESAGAHLAMLTTLHLLQHKDATFSAFRFKGLILHFGCYTFSWLPHCYNWNRSPCLVLDRDLMEAYRDAFIPGWTQKTLEDPNVSPLYADLEPLRGRLPPALFTCGTEDPLLDDTVFMSAKWRVVGGEAVVKIAPGAPHGYCMFPRETRGALADVGMGWVEEFIGRKLRS